MGDSTERTDQVLALALKIVRFLVGMEVKRRVRIWPEAARCVSKLLNRCVFLGCVWLNP